MPSKNGIGSMLKINRKRFICLVTCKKIKVLFFILFCCNNAKAVKNSARFNNGPARAISALAKEVTCATCAAPMLTYAGTKKMKLKRNSLRAMPMISQK